MGPDSRGCSTRIFAVWLEAPVPVRVGEASASVRWPDGGARESSLPPPDGRAPWVSVPLCTWGLLGAGQWELGPQQGGVPLPMCVGLASDLSPPHLPGFTEAQVPQLEG